MLVNCFTQWVRGSIWSSLDELVELHSCGNVWKESTPSTHNLGGGRVSLCYREFGSSFSLGSSSGVELLHSSCPGKFGGGGGYMSRNFTWCNGVSWGQSKLCCSISEDACFLGENDGVKRTFRSRMFCRRLWGTVVTVVTPFARFRLEVGLHHYTSQLS